MSTQNRNLNGYIFVVRMSGNVAAKSNAELYEHQQATAYLMKLGARFVVITHDNTSETTKRINQIFGFATSAGSNVYMTPNDGQDVYATLQKIRRSQAVHSTKQLIYIDTYQPYVQIAASSGFIARQIRSFTRDSVAELSAALIRGNRS